MSAELKYPKKGAVARLREFYLEIVKKPLTPEQRANLEEVFKKKDQSKANEKKIAKPNEDAGLA